MTHDPRPHVRRRHTQACIYRIAPNTCLKHRINKPFIELINSQRVPYLPYPSPGMLLSDSPRPGAAGAGSRPARWKSFALLAGRLLLVSLFLIAGACAGMARQGCRVRAAPRCVIQC